jgi:hypothetical protein
VSGTTLNPLTPPPDDDHDCGWKAYAKHQEAKLSELQQQLEAMKAKVEQLALLAKGHKSERRKISKKMPPPVKAKPEPQETLDGHEARRACSRRLQCSRTTKDI